MRSLVHLHAVLFQQQLPCEEWWYQLLVPHRHYLPVSKDLSDLEEQATPTPTPTRTLTLRASQITPPKTVTVGDFLLLNSLSAERKP